MDVTSGFLLNEKALSNGFALAMASILEGIDTSPIDLIVLTGSDLDVSKTVTVHQLSLAIFAHSKVSFL